MIGLSRKSVLILLVAVLLLTGFLLKVFIPGNRSADFNDTRLPNVIIISLDGLRPDHLSCYGYQHDVFAAVNSLAAEGIVFENHFSQSPIPFRLTFRC